MNDAVKEVWKRAVCCVEDGDRDAKAIIRECYELEVSEWFSWELLETVFNADDFITPDVEEALIDYLINELENDVQDLIDEAEEEEVEEEEE